MSKSELLREKQTKLWNQMTDFLDTKQTADGMISKADAEVYDKMEGELTEIGNQIERLEQREKMRLQFANTSQPIVDVPINHAYDSYSNAFWNAIRGRGISNVLSEGSDTAGGYLVPDEFANDLAQALSEQNIFRQISRIVKTSSDRLKIPVAEGGATVNWISENAEIPETSVTFNQVVLNPYKLGCLIRASTELMEDSVFDLQRHIADQFAKEIGKAEEEAFCIGVGDDRPSGIFSGGADVGVTTSSKTAITFDDVIDLLHSVKPPYRGKSVFVTNDSTIRELRKIKDGNGQYIWQPAVKDGLPDTILARPVYICPYVPVIEAGANVMAFGDFNNYWIADRRNFRFKVLNERFAENDQVGFHATARVDGKLVFKEAVKLLQMGE
jgi:HK97 family phage major capsid protein